ncbi:MAG: hypothetical protein IRZ32_17695 [Solirubrobacteraceae bacterium]|nr:hypothetical protein [Solirubrobacteraceae bacterium]
MGWTFVYLMVVLKLPIIALLLIVWWAIRQRPDAGEPPADDGDGGSRRPRHPRPPLRPLPRRGPHHGAAPPAPPARVRAVASSAGRGHGAAH